MTFVMITQTYLNANLMEAIVAGVSKEHALNVIATVSCDLILIFIYVVHVITFFIISYKL